ncbi:MAG: hypothetical protein IKE91_03115 [Clostridia bacterium]|nr:hypothetical protein [Clostridia bacterium]
MVTSYNQKLNDFEILKKVVNKEISMDDIDLDTKIRLIQLCDNRISDINKKIEDIDKKIYKITKH